MANSIKMEITETFYSVKMFVGRFEIKSFRDRTQRWTMKIFILLFVVGTVKSFEYEDDEEYTNDSEKHRDIPFEDSNIEKDQIIQSNINLSQLKEDEKERKKYYLEYQDFLSPLELYFKQLQESMLRLQDVRLEAENKMFSSQYAKPSFLEAIFHEHHDNAALRMMRNIIILSTKVLEKHNRKHDADEYLQRTSLSQLNYSSLSAQSHSRQVFESDESSLGRRELDEETSDNIDYSIESRKENIQELDAEIAKMTKRVDKLHQLMTGIGRVARKRILSLS